MKAAQDIFNDLRFSFPVQYDDTGSIGKLYRRQDAIGTPFCITVDFETLENHTVTLRERDSMQQERVAISELENIIRRRVDFKTLLQAYYRLGARR